MREQWKPPPLYLNFRSVSEERNVAQHLTLPAPRRPFGISSTIAVKLRRAKKSVRFKKASQSYRRSL